MNFSTDINVSTQILSERSVLSALESNLAMIEFNLNREVIWVNENFANILGYTVHEMERMQHKYLCTPDFRDSKEYEFLWDSLSNGVKFQEKILRIGKKGDLLWLEATYIPVLNEKGKVDAVLKIATDVTEREMNTTTTIFKLKYMPTELVDIVMVNANENIKAVESLKQQTNLISGISKTIKNISVQTNMLALNATIEAARFVSSFSRSSYY